MSPQEFAALVEKMRAAQKRATFAPAYATMEDAAVAANYERAVDLALAQSPPPMDPEDRR